MNNTEIKYIVVDLFAGAGGTTIGFEKALDKLGRKFCAVIAAVNHDPVAIKSHWHNHPSVEHFEEDITKMYGMVKHGILFKSDHLIRLVRLAELYRSFYPNAKLILWASLECTNFSNAKGGAEKDADSRTLAQHLDRYVDALEPDMIQIENVKEFKYWGPLKIKASAGKFKGYNCSKLMCKLDSDGNILTYKLEPVSKAAGQDWLKWKQALCESFGYKDDWKEMNSADFGAFTARNRLFGLFVRKGESFVWPQQTHSKKIAEAPTLFSDENIMPWNGVKPCISLDKKGKSIVYRNKQLKETTLKRHYNGLLKHLANMNEESFEMLLNTQSKSPVRSNSSAFLSNYHGSGHNTSSINSPSGALVCADIHSIVFIDQQYSGKTNHQSIDSPLWSITCNPKSALIQTHGFIFNPGWFGADSSLDNPCPTIVASQHKAPLSIVQAETGHFNHRIESSDSEMIKKIKRFMNYFQISDVTMRMLFVDELKKIQGFPNEYVLKGTQKDQKKAIGNSVHPLVVTKWISAFNENNVYLERMVA